MNRSFDNKKRLNEQMIALRAAKELKDGWYVNLGVGIPTLIAMKMPLPDKQIVLMSETGLLNYGRMCTPEEMKSSSWIHLDASGAPVQTLPGMSIFNIEEAFDMIRSGKLDCTVLGGLQVSEKGDLANWRAPKMLTSIGGAMDLVTGARRVIVCMTHTTRDGEPKIVHECTHPITGKRCVKLMITDIAVIQVMKNGLLLKEVAPGWSAEEVQQLTKPKLQVSPDLKEIEV